MDKQQLLDILRETKAILAKPENWTKHAFARTRPARADDPFDLESRAGPCEEEATCWCTAGAIRAACCRLVPEYDDGNWWDSPTYNGVWEAVTNTMADDGMSLTGISDYNDRRATNHGDILSLLDRTIEAQEAAA